MHALRDINPVLQTTMSRNTSSSLKYVNKLGVGLVPTSVSEEIYDVGGSLTKDLKGLKGFNLYGYSMSSLYKEQFKNISFTRNIERYNFFQYTTFIKVI